jgi:hypothetical protein
MGTTLSIHSGPLLNRLASPDSRRRDEAKPRLLEAVEEDMISRTTSG